MASKNFWQKTARNNDFYQEQAKNNGKVQDK